MNRSNEFKSNGNGRSARSRGGARNTRRRPTRRAKAPTDPVGPSVGTALLRNTPVFQHSFTRNGILYYESGLVLAPAAGTVSYYRFSANGLFDPNITGTGHQPIGFDQMMLFFEQYTVLRSRIKVTCVGFSDDPATCAVLLAPDTTSTVLPELVENGLLVMDMVVAAADNLGDGYHRIKRLELECDVAKYFGRSREALIADPNMLGTSAANPTEQVYFTIAVWNPFSAGTSVSMEVVLTYDAYFWEPRKVAAS
jgi:hypothetical protein